MAVPAQLDADEPSIPDLASAAMTGGKSISPSPNIKCSWTPGPHVLDVDIRQPVGPAANLVGNRHLALAMQVADIDCQAQPRRIDAASASSSSRSA